MSVSVLARPRILSLRIPASLLGVFICLAGALAVLRPVLDPDIEWHLRTGQMILATHHIPTVDPYSFTRAGAPWVEHEWLWQVAVAMFSLLGGHVAIVLANGAAVSLTLGLVYLQLRDRNASACFAAMGAGLALVNLVVYAEARPGEVVALLTAVLLFALERYRRTGNWRWLALVPVTELIWANCHGSYVLGLLLCGIYGLAALWETHAWRAVVPWAVAALSAAAASLINPLGLGLYRFTLSASQLSVNRQFVHEWMPPDFRMLSFAPVLVTLVLLIAVPTVMRVAPRGRAQQLLLVTGCIAVLESQQFILFFAIVAAPQLGELLQQALPASHLEDLSPLTCAALSVVLLGLAVVGPATHLTPAAYREAVARDYPVDAVNFIESNQLQGPMFNEFDWGGYLIGALPRLPVFADGRTEMYGNEFEARAVDIAYGSRPVAPVLDQYAINLALVKTHTVVADQLNSLPGWRRAYEDKLASVFVRESE